MYKKNHIFLLALGLLSCMSGICQEMASGNKVQMADGMRANGKIYVVVAVLITILLGLVLYVARLDKKITRLEKEIK